MKKQTIDLYEYQREAVSKMKNGCILCGDVGTGKSRTALAYYHYLHGGVLSKFEYIPMTDPRDLYIITTARKRDTKEWEGELLPFLLSSNPDRNTYKNKVVIDSWNNIKKYKDVYGAFFIFDEQRVVGSGAWVKAFLNIARKNRWILLSATPGDTWTDYIPVFVANGFYKNKTDFVRQHVIYSRFAKYPKIDRYVNTGRLVKERNEILVHMKNTKLTERHYKTVTVDYDKVLYSLVSRDRWDPYDNEPIRETGKLCYLMRRVTNSDESRIKALKDLVLKHKRSIIFYNFDYELEMMRDAFNTMRFTFSEWNGKKHEPIPDTDSWAYLVQYSAGAEGWNCITTDTIIFFSQNYSYRITVQAEGRIDRLNTKYKDLYYYRLISNAPIDKAISRALRCKQNFNERSFLRA